jgi:hypothetical protein
MKAPLAILIAIMVFMLGFLVVYSQQRDVTAANTDKGHAAGGGYGSSAAPASGGYGSSGAAPAAGGYGAAPSQAGGYGAAPAPKSGGYGAAPAPSQAGTGHRQQVDINSSRITDPGTALITTDKHSQNWSFRDHR